MAGNARSAPIGTVTSAAKNTAQMLPCAPPSRVYATAPMPANASGASDTWPAQPVSGTSESATSAVHMPSVRRLTLVGIRARQGTQPRRHDDDEHGHADRGVAHRRDPLDAPDLARCGANWISARGSEQQHDEEHDRRQRVGNVRPPVGELEERARRHWMASARISAPR